MKWTTNRKQFPGHLSAPHTFKAQLLISILKIAVPVIIIICTGSFLVLSKSSEQTILKAQTTAMGKIENDLTFITENTENLSRDMIFNNEIQQLLLDFARGEQYPESSAAAYYINNFIANRDFIDCVVLTGNDKTLYSTERAFTNFSDFQSIRQKWWFSEMTAEKQPYQWYSASDETKKTSMSESGDPAAPHLMLARSIYSLKDYTTRLGYLMIYLDDAYLKNIWDSCQFGDTTNLWILNASGEVLLTNAPQNDYSALLSDIPSDSQQVVRYQGRKFVTGSQTLSQNGWTLCMATPYQEVNTSAAIFTIQLLLLITAILLILIFLSIHTASAISKPIIYLSEIMDSFHGKEKKEITELSADMYNARQDEIGQIYQSYQQMVKRMDTLIQEIYIKNLEKKDAELALLQSQINPHFLYNTLDSINWMALAEGQDEISEMVTALSDTFRLSLTKSGSSYVQISQEAAYVKSYLVLQKFRYAERLTYSFYIEPNTQDLYIPKFILQPIVENALKHGINLLESGGTLHISITRTASGLSICVRNDGSNIDLDQMNELLEFDPEHMELLSFNPKGYGVQNIHRRIRLLCGIQYGLSYRIDGDTTICEILLPQKQNDS